MWVAALVWAPSALHAEALEIWVAPGFYGVEQSNCSSTSSTEPAVIFTNIDERLCSILEKKDREEISAFFAGEMASSQFADHLVEVPGAKLPASIPINQRLRSTLVASLHISRADIWEVDKFNGSREVHLPNTVSLLLTNVRTGEVVFTETRSLISTGLTLGGNVASYAKQQISDQIRANITALVKQAAERFRPNPIRATIAGSFDGKYVIDKGRSAGIRRDDRLNADMKVLFADSDYAIVTAGLEQGLKTGSVLEMQNVQPADYLSKHSALVIFGIPPTNMSAAYLKQTFEEKLGATSLFSISPVNPSVASIRLVASSKVGSTINSEKRLPPEYFVYVQSFVTENTSVATNIPNVALKTFEAYSIGQIVDRSGRVLFSRVVNDRIVDEVAAEIGFPDDQRKDTAVRNSLEKLASVMQSEFKPSSVRLPIEKIGSESIVIDTGGLLAEGASGVVLRKVGTFGGIKGAVWAPVGGFSRVEYVNGRPNLIGDELDGAPNKGDLFTIDGGGANAGQSRRAYTLCEAPLGLPSQDLSGAPLIRAIGRSNFASAANVPVYIDELPALATAQLQATFGGLEQLGAIQTRKPDICFKPIFRFSPLAEVKGGRGQLSARYALSVGYTLHSTSGERLSGSGVQVELSTSPVPVDTPPDEIRKGEMREFIFQMNKIAPATINNLKLSQMEE
jgi:hypothetical protein